MTETMTVGGTYAVACACRGGVWYAYIPDMDTAVSIAQAHADRVREAGGFCEPHIRREV